MRTFYKVYILTVIAGYATCSIAGLTFMDHMELKTSKPINDECNPPYWYPRHIPEHCYHNNTPPLPPPPVPIPVPIPVQMPPVGVAIPYQPFLPWPPQPMWPPNMPILPPPPPNACYCPQCVMPMLPPPPLPPSNSCPPCPPCPPPPVPVMPLQPMYPPGMPYPFIPPYPRPPPAQAGMVPGIPGIVSPDGGINVLPFSDAYSDLLEKLKNKELRKQYRRVINKYG